MMLETYFTAAQQMRLFLAAIILGLPLGICFDIQRTGRLFWRHSVWLTAIEDVFFLLFWAGALLCFSTVLARGELRFYYALGSGLGFLLYRCTIGVVTVPLLRRLLELLYRIFSPIFRLVYHGIVRIYSKIKEKFGHFAKLSGNALFFSHLPLIDSRKMLYNTNIGNAEREAAQKWQRQSKRKRSSHAGFSGSSAGRQS